MPTGVKPPLCIVVQQVGRLDDYLRDVAQDMKLGLDESVITMAGLAVAKRTYHILQEMKSDAIIMPAGLAGRLPSHGNGRRPAALYHQYPGSGYDLGGGSSPGGEDRRAYSWQRRSRSFSWTGVCPGPTSPDGMKPPSSLLTALPRNCSASLWRPAGPRWRRTCPRRKPAVGSDLLPCVRRDSSKIKGFSKQSHCL